MKLTAQDKRAARDGFKYVVVRQGKRVAYTTTMTEAKNECGKAGRVVSIAGMTYAAQNPRKRRNPRRHVTGGPFASLSSARQYVLRNDLSGVYVVEGKGTAFAPFAVLDAGVAEDLLSDDLGRQGAQQLLRGLDAAGKFVVRMKDYRPARTSAKARNPSAADVGHSVGKHAKYAARGAKRVGKAAYEGAKSFFGSAYKSFKEHNPSRVPKEFKIKHIKGVGAGDVYVVTDVRGAPMGKYRTRGEAVRTAEQLHRLLVGNGINGLDRRRGRRGRP